MRTVRKEVKTYKDVYVAEDDTEFLTKEECQKYEETANAVIHAQYRKLVTNTVSENALFGCGSDDCYYDIVKCTLNDKDTILKALFISQPQYKNDNMKDNLKVAISRIEEACSKEAHLFIDRGYDYEGFYIVGTANHIIDNIITNLSKVIDKDGKDSL